MSECRHRYQRVEVLADTSAWTVCAHCGYAEPLHRVADSRTAKAGDMIWTGSTLGADEEMTVVLPWVP
jgi:hypothetical protein